MTKHGFSHGAAVLICTLLAGLAIELVQRYLPEVHDFLRDLSAAIVVHLPLGYTNDFINMMLYATILATMWGVAFSLVHHD